MFYTMSMSSDIIVSYHLTLSHMPLHSCASSCSKAKREKKIKYKGPEQIITSQTLDHTHTHTHSLSLFSTKKKQKKKKTFHFSLTKPALASELSWPISHLSHLSHLSLITPSSSPSPSLSHLVQYLTCTVSLITSLPVRDKILLRHHIPPFFFSKAWNS